jgi:ParB-like chromosome segregation protein Spo0J
MSKKTIEEATERARDERAGIVQASEIEQWPIARLKPYKKNAKRHPGEQVARIAQLIKEHGFDQPIVVDTRGVIVKGHGRWLAAKALKMATVPVIVSHLSLDDGRLREARLGDNRVAEFGWDPDKLVSDVVEGLSEGLRVELTGFTLAELGLEAEPSEAQDDVPLMDDEGEREEHDDEDQDDEPVTPLDAASAIAKGAREIQAYAKQWVKEHNKQHPEARVKIAEWTLTLEEKE